MRLLRPEALSVDFLLTFETFGGLFSPKSMLSDALVRTVSTQSEAVDGQRCGQTTTIHDSEPRNSSNVTHK